MHYITVHGFVGKMIDRQTDRHSHRHMHTLTHAHTTQAYWILFSISERISNAALNIMTYGNLILTQYGTAGI